MIIYVFFSETINPTGTEWATAGKLKIKKPAGLTPNINKKIDDFTSLQLPVSTLIYAYKLLKNAILFVHELSSLLMLLQFSFKLFCIEIQFTGARYLCHLIEEIFHLLRNLTWTELFFRWFTAQIAVAFLGRWLPFYCEKVPNIKLSVTWFRILFSEKSNE